MTGWSFERMVEATGGRWLRAPKAGERLPQGAAIDTREVRPGMLFAAFRGERTDGHAHLGEAVLNGAAMLVVTDAGAVVGPAVPTLLVNDAGDALAALADLWRSSLPGLRVVGVTGSNGKTTTCRMLYAAACTEAVGGMPGTAPAKSFNNRLGVPITLLNARPGDGVVVCEIGMSTPGEIAARCALARPDAAIITTIAEAHLAGLGSIEAIAREKASIAAGIGPEGLVVIPSGLPLLDDALRALGTRARVIRVGGHADAEHRLTDIAGDGATTRFRLDGEAFEIPLTGAHNASNAALAIVAARWLGVADAAIRAGLAAAVPVPMRLERSVVATEPPILVINDAYNANPGSMRAALRVLAETEAPGRRVAVLGDMLELGPAAAAAHAMILHAVRESGADAVLTLGPLFAGAGGADHAETDTDDAAVLRLATLIRPGDTVLVKGSRGMRLERLVGLLAARSPEGATA